MNIILIYLFLQVVYVSLQNIEMRGRWLQLGDEYLADWPGVSINFQLQGATYLRLELGDQNSLGIQNIHYLLDIWENGDHYGSININHTQNRQIIRIADKLIASKIYNFTFIKITEGDDGWMDTLGPWVLRQVLTDGQIIMPNKSKLKFLFIGDSITAGWGVDGIPPCVDFAGTQNNDHTYGRYVSEYFSADYTIIAKSGMGVVKNAGDKTRNNVTMLTFYPRTLSVSDIYSYFEQKFIPDYVSINLGTNDYVTEPWPDDIEFIQTFFDFVNNKIALTYPSSKIILSCGPMFNETKPLCTNVQTIVRILNDNLGDRVKYLDMQNILTPEEYGCNDHPNAKGEKKMANLVIDLINRWSDNLI